MQAQQRLALAENRVTVHIPVERALEHSPASLFTFITPQKSPRVGTSLVAQWLRIRLPMQGT